MEHEKLVLVKIVNKLTIVAQSKQGVNKGMLRSLKIMMS